MDDEQKFASFVPGQISNKLRKALGLAKHQLPNHIYKMRTLGYPPGWMEDAKISHSGLTLYDCKGKGKCLCFLKETYFHLLKLKLFKIIFAVWPCGFKPGQG